MGSEVLASAQGCEQQAGGYSQRLQAVKILRTSGLACELPFNRGYGLKAGYRLPERKSRFRESQNPATLAGLELVPIVDELVFKNPADPRVKAEQAE